MNNFEISIKDNFFEKSLFEKIKNNLINLKWDPKNMNFLGKGSFCKHPWFSCNIYEEDIKNSIIKNVKNYFNKEIINFNLINYSLVTKIAAPLPHNDLQENVNYQILIYLKGEDTLTNGTGFYIKKENNYILNTHVGFTENRAIFFKTDVFHSPLTWDENSSVRYSIVGHLKVKE
jgi:hypothetical protein